MLILWVATGITLLASLTCYSRFVHGQSPRKSAIVLVLGDLGRSPRMQNHALSLAQHGYGVTLIGNRGADLYADVLSNPQIKTLNLPSLPKYLTTSNKLLFLLYAPFKVALQLASLFYYLLRAHGKLILLQVKSNYLSTGD